LDFPPLLRSLYPIPGRHEEAVFAYSDKLTIITLSGDAGKKTWLDGLKRDQPDWLSLWDEKQL